MTLSYRLTYAFFLLYLALGLLVVGVAWGKRRRLPPPLRWFAAYLAANFGVELLQLLLARLGINNHWVGYATVPLITALFLLAFAEWQADTTVRRVIRWLVPLCALFWLPPLLGLERVSGFSLFTSTAQALLCLTVSAFTLVRRWLDTPLPPARQDWFWVGSGAMLYFATYALVSPLSRYLMSQGDAESVLRMYAVRGIMASVTMGLYWRAFRDVPAGPATAGLPA